MTGRLGLCWAPGPDDDAGAEMVLGDDPRERSDEPETIGSTGIVSPAGKMRERIRALGLGRMDLHDGAVSGLLVEALVLRLESLTVEALALRAAAEGAAALLAGAPLPEGAGWHVVGVCGPLHVVGEVDEAQALEVLARLRAALRAP